MKIRFRMPKCWTVLCNVYVVTVVYCTCIQVNNKAFSLQQCFQIVVIGIKNACSYTEFDTI